MKSRRPITFATIFSIFVVCSLMDNWTLAQSRQVPAPQQAQPFVIFGATIHPVSSASIDNGYIIFENGVITDIGRGDPPGVRADASQAIRMNGNGLHVYPGLISSSTYLGLTETGAVDVTHDHTEYGRVTPEARAASAINPDTDLIPVTRANGILTANVLPRGGLISGRASIIRMDGWTWEEMAIEPVAGLVLNWPQTEPFVAWWLNQTEEEQREQMKKDAEMLENVFDEAEAYVRAKDANPTVETDLRYEAMRPMVQGKAPIFVEADLRSEIEAAIAWANRRGYRIIIVGGQQADQVTTLLKKYDISVVIDGTHRLPRRRHDDYDQTFRLPLKLHEAGVRYCIASGAGPAHERGLNHVVATAAAYGLPKEEALKAVTMYAAQILGVDDKLGSLEKGKSATLIVSDGDPLEITTDVLVAFIDGRRIDLGSRHKSLYEKYQEKYRQLGLLNE